MEAINIILQIIPPMIMNLPGHRFCLRGVPRLHKGNRPYRCERAEVSELALASKGVEIMSARKVAVVRTHLLQFPRGLMQEMPF